MGKEGEDSTTKVESPVNCEHFSSKHRYLIAALQKENAPEILKQTMRHEGCRKEIAAETDALEEQGTWTLESLPTGKKALGSKWVYTEKRDEDGNLLRLKARLVCLGNHQEQGLDYNETFARPSGEIGDSSYFSSNCNS
ncbi:uncharacterized mitochondrial protein AtMg00820-like [Spinacia oleracea]|uniref:Uncharacterized mitochondrial protein AtMg00820-like n=1 Tax=Spinacia oleracea TaxID=3562 RepID=A0ABM3RHR6_SPIOL|nr:uncharacterized mitochondrial protein AtMg00820-like [Spinacia oleracea]